MRPTFRSVSFWQSALMTLPNATFFDLLRSILGTVKTPFNKQTLVEELSRLIIRPEIQEIIAAYLDINDRKIIAAIALLSEPVPGELESFFTGEYSYAELQGMLLNLEERLIIYRFRDNDVLRIALNPRLEGVLAPYVSNTEILFPAAAAIETEPLESGDDSASSQVKSGVLDGRTLAAFFTFLLNNEVQIKDDGTGKDLSFVFRKKATEQAKSLFPGLNINAAAGGLLTLGLLVQEEDGITADEAKIAAFKELPNRDLFEYLAGGIALFLYRGGIYTSYQGRGLLRNTIRLIHDLGGIAKDGKILSEATMIKLAELFRRQEESDWDFTGGVPPAAVLLQALVMAGLFSIVPIDGTNYYRPVISAKAAKTGAKQHPLIAMDSGFSCVLYPEISFTDALDLAACSLVEETGTAVRFVFSRETVVRGFDRGYTAEFIWQLLERLSGGRTSDDTLKWNLHDWEKRWREVSLNQGVILTLSDERVYLAKTFPLSSMIKQTLGPGIYLLSAEIDEAASALRDAGVDIVARPGAKPDRPSSFFSPLGKLEAISLPGQILDKPASEKKAKKEAAEKEDLEKTETAENSAEQIKERFRRALGKMKLTKQEQEELESRIERRMVVSETQLKDTSLRYERLEARSLDYVGKTGIVRQAISTGSLLELSCLNGEKILGTPESLDKKGNEMILTIRPREGGEPVKLTLGKISLVRRIKQSIFGV